jgi:ribonuclease J
MAQFTKRAILASVVKLLNQRPLDKITVKDVVEDSLEDAEEAGTREVHLIQEDMHDAIGGLVYEKLRRRPMILPVVVEV